FYVLSAACARQPRAQRIKCRRNRDSPRISILAICGRQEVFPFLCQDNPWQLLASFGRYRTNPSRATVFTIPVFRLPSRRWPCTSRRTGLPATAPAMIITMWSLCVVRGRRRLNADKAFQQSFRDDRLLALIKIDDEGKKRARARAIPHHPARRHGARYLKSGVGLTSYARYARAARRSSRT